MVSSLLFALISIATGAQTECSVLYFQSAQCEPCRQYEPTLHQLQQQGWKIQQIDAPAHLDLAKQFQIRNLPTLVVLCGQKEIDRIVGVTSFEQLHNRLSRVAARNRSASLPQIPSQVPIASQQPSFAMSDNAKLSPVAQPSPQLIVRGQSVSAGDLGQAFPLLAANSSSSRPKVDRAMSTDPWTRVVARATDATVRIKVEESNTIAYGTGTIVAVHGDEALVLTCGHLFREMLSGSQLTVDLFAGTAKKVTLVAQLIDFKADEEDIALLSVRLPVQVEPVPILPRGEVVQKGQPVFTIGCDHGNDPTRHETKIVSVNRYLGAANIEIAGAPAVGRSGGGMFDAQGRLLGVCNAACKEDNEGIYAGIEVVYQQLARLGQTHLFENTSSLAGSDSINDSAAGQANAVATGRLNLAGNSAPLGKSTESPNATPIAGTTNGSTSWPDEDPRLTLGQLASAEPRLELQLNEPTQTTSGSQLTCLLRDATGKERVINIPQPSPSLLQAIEQHSAQLR